MSGEAKQPSKEQQEAQARAQEEAVTGIIAQVCTPAARERLARIGLVRPDRAKAVQELLVRLATSGQLQHRIEENELVSLLDRVSEPQANKLIFSHRPRDDDELELPEEPSKNQAAGNAEDDDFFD